MSYCLVRKNKIYENLYDMIEAEELSMEKEEDSNKIKHLIKNFMRKFEKKYIEYKKVENTDDMIGDIVNNFIEDEEYETQGNTILCQIYENYMYEIIYSENLNKNIIKKDENMNEFLSICNVDMEPIYNSGVIIKTVYKEGKMYNETVNFEDIERIIINNFYYRGVIVDSKEEIVEIEFTGENVIKKIGNTFEMEGVHEIFELTLVVYKEKEGEINKMMSKILGREYRGRVFVGLLCPISKKKFMHMTKNIIRNIYEISKDEEKSRKLNYELHQTDKLMNPLLIMDKYK